MSLQTAAWPIVLLAGVLVMPSASAADPVVIVSPQSGDVLPPAFSVKVTFGEVEFCDTDGCIQAPADRVVLYADDAAQDLCDPCVGGEAEFAVMLEPGPHELRAAAGYQQISDLSEIVKITVDESATTEASDGASSDASAASASDATSEGDPGSKDGCACGAGAGATRGLPWCALFCLGASRGRKKQRRRFDGSSSPRTSTRAPHHAEGARVDTRPRSR